MEPSLKNGTERPKTRLLHAPHGTACATPPFNHFFSRFLLSLQNYLSFQRQPPIDFPSATIPEHIPHCLKPLSQSVVPAFLIGAQTSRVGGYSLPVCLPWNSGAPLRPLFMLSTSTLWPPFPCAWDALPLGSCNLQLRCHLLGNLLWQSHLLDKYQVRLFFSPELLLSVVLSVTLTCKSWELSFVFLTGLLILS